MHAVVCLIESCDRGSHSHNSGGFHYDRLDPKLQHSLASGHDGANKEFMVQRLNTFLFQLHA